MGSPWALGVGRVFGEAVEEFEGFGELAVLLGGELMEDGGGEPVVAGGPAFAEELLAFLAEGHEGFAAVVGIGSSADQAGLLERGDDGAHGLGAHAFGAGQGGDCGGAILFEAKEDGDLRG